jgi:hypothetical protein
MELPYRRERVVEAGEAFDELVWKIEDRDFRVFRVPEPKVCKECDLRALCVADGILKAPGRTRGRARR